MQRSDLNSKIAWEDKGRGNLRRRSGVARGPIDMERPMVHGSLPDQSTDWWQNRGLKGGQ